MLRPQVDDWLARLRSLRRVALDTNAVVYTLEGIEPYNTLVAHVLELMERGILTGVVSTIVEIEVLVKPLRGGDLTAVTVAEMFFRESPNLVIRGVDRGVSRRAAEIRAQTSLSLPDAIIAATALQEGCEAVIGNDLDMATHMIGIPYILLNAYCK